jgi:hypothetical protein
MLPEVAGDASELADEASSLLLRHQMEREMAGKEVVVK